MTIDYENMTEVIRVLLEEYEVVPWQGNCESALIWARDLETTKASQGRTRLRNSRKELCCLGVACDSLSVIEGKEHVWQFMPHANCYSYHTETDVLPWQVQQWLGCDQNPLMLRSKSEGSKLSIVFASQLNDLMRLSFKEIAWIVREAVRLATDG